MDVARLLIEHGADIDAKADHATQQNDTPLHDAAWTNSLDVARLLIDLGADIEAKNDDGSAPLHWAAEQNSLDVATPAD